LHYTAALGDSDTDPTMLTLSAVSAYETYVDGFMASTFFAGTNGYWE